jgi:hypothetical protein
VSCPHGDRATRAKAPEDADSGGVGGCEERVPAEEAEGVDG